MQNWENKNRKYRMGIKPSYNSNFYADGGEDEWDDEPENEDYTDYENEASEVSGGVPAEDMPKFRQLVRAKKLELKATYGKARRRECGIRPVRISYSPNIKIPEVKIGKKVITKGNVEAYDNATQRWNDDMRRWRECREAKSGWRKKWRDFKRSGGLGQLKLQAKGMFVPPTSWTNENPGGGASGGGNRRVPSGYRDGSASPGTKGTESNIKKYIGISIGLALLAGAGVGLYMHLKSGKK